MISVQSIGYFFTIFATNILDDETPTTIVIETQDMITGVPSSIKKQIL
jgi:hypothetical protein